MANYTFKTVDSPLEMDMLPLQFYFSCSEDWLLNKIKEEMPEQLVLDQAELHLGDLVVISDEKAFLALRLDVNANLKGPMNVKIAGDLQLDISLESIADFENIKVDISAYRWINGPKINWWKFPLGFAKKRVNKELDKLVEKAPNRIASIVQKKIKNVLETPAYRPLILPSIKPFENKVHFLATESLSYQTKKENGLLHLGVFPSANLYLGKDKIPEAFAPIKLAPGVGGNRCLGSISLTQDQINLITKENFIGRNFKVKNYDFTIQNIKVVCGEKMINVVCHFKEFSSAPLTMGLTLHLNQEKQLLSFDLVEFNWKPNNLLLKAILIFFKSRIANELEEKLQFDIQALVTQQLELQKHKVVSALEKQQLHLENWTPSIIIDSIEVSPGHVISTGQLVGEIRVQSEADKDQTI